MSNVTQLRPQHPQLRIRRIGDLWEQDIPDAEPILGTWLHQRHLSMVYAPAGCGKSLFTMSIATAVAGGGSLFGWKASKPRRVLLVDGEMDLVDLKTRSKALLTALPDADADEVGRNLFLFAYHDQLPGTTFPDIATEEGRHELLSRAAEAQAELVILDNFSTLATIDDENAASSFDPFIDLMRQLKLAGRAAILVHHSRKGNAGDSAYRGTSKMAVIFNTIIKLDYPDGVKPRGEAGFDLIFEKFRGLTDASTDPLRARLRPREEWSYEPAPGSLIKQLVALVRTVEFGTQDALAAELGVSKGQVSKLKKKAFALGEIKPEEWDKCLEMAREGDEADEGEVGGPDF